jgi:phage-related holin
MYSQSLSPHLADTGHPLHTTALQLAAAGWVLAPIVAFVERYLWNDWEFAAALAVLITLDTLCGLVRAWKHHRLNSQCLNGLLLKVFAYGAALVMVHTISHHTVHGKPNSLLADVVPWLDAALYGAILFREALSIHEHLAALGYSVLPVWALRRLTSWSLHHLPTLPPEPKPDHDSSPN